MSWTLTMNISAGEKLANILESHGLRKVNIPGDGHCLLSKSKI